MLLHRNTIFAGIAVGAAVSLMAIPITNQRMATSTSVEVAMPSIATPSMQSVGAAPAFVRISEDDLEGRELELLYQEDFSGLAEGSEAEPVLWASGWISCDGFTATPGWSGNGIYAAGGVLALYNPGQDGFQGGGCINSPLDNYAGTIIVKFRVKADVTGEAYVMTTLCKGGVEYPSAASDTEMLSIKKDDGWVDVVYEMTNLSTALDGFLQINAITFNGKGFFVDDISIYRDLSNILPPQNAAADKFTRDGFTASWDKLPYAEKYKLAIYEEESLGSEMVENIEDWGNITISEDLHFNTEETPEGWEIHLVGPTQVTADQGYDGSKSIVFSSDSDYIILPFSGSYTKLKFFLRPYGENPKDCGYFYIEGFDPSIGEWTRYAYMTTEAINSEAGYMVDVSEYEAQYPSMYAFKNKYTAIRLHTQNLKEGTGTLAIDNIEYETNPMLKRTLIDDNIITESNSYTFSGLDPYKEHYFSVQCLSGNRASEFSNTFHAFGISGIEGLEAVDIDPRGGVTAKWDETPRATYYVVGAYNADKIAEDQENYKILAEYFDKVTVRNPVTDPMFLYNENSLISLDDYTETPGWQGRGNILAKGMLGCIEDPYGMFEIYTPEITLSADNGKYSVHMQVYAEEGAQFVVQGSDSYQVVNFYTTGTQEFTLCFENGKDHDQLMFYTISGEQFLIDYIEVMQNVKKGDYLYSLIDKSTTTDTSYRFSISPEEGKNYGLQVQAFQEIFNKTCKSELSPIVIVDFFDDGVEEIPYEAGQRFKAYGIGSTLRVETIDRDVTLIDISGRIVSTIKAGKSLDLELSQGVYILTDGMHSAKISIVR
ncbi:MAG: hypothetical protein ACI4AK_04240 [Lepagella sp.]